MIKCITEIDGTTIDNTEDLDLVMPIYNLIEGISSYSHTAGGYSKDEATDFNDVIASNGDWKSFKCKAIFLGNAEADEANIILKMH